MTAPVAPTADHAIWAKNLRHVFRDGSEQKTALDVTELGIRRGDVVLVTGRSGSGKTTLLTLLGALRRVQQPEVGGPAPYLEVLGHRLHEKSADLVEVRRQIGFIFQGHNLFQALTAEQNVDMARELFPAARADRDGWVRDLEKRLEIEEVIHKNPARLSGGQRQRVAIVRALANRPRLILADEPTAALDPRTARAVVELLGECARAGGTVLIVTHDHSSYARIVNRYLGIDYGRIKWNKTTRQIEEIADFLTTCPSFQRLEVGRPLAPGTLQDFALKMTLEEHLPGTVVIREGDEPDPDEPDPDRARDKAYVVKEGRLEVWREGQLLAELQPRDLFGEAALTTRGGQENTRRPRNATVKVSAEQVPVARLYALRGKDFQEALATQSFLDEMVKLIAERRRPGPEPESLPDFHI
jgi:putative ABC transport system ATP-binding protein